MSTGRRLETETKGDVTVVKFVDRKILDDASINQLANELYKLLEEEHKNRLLLNFSNVEFLSSAALGKLITLDRKVKQHEGLLKLSNIRPEIYDVFVITRLNRLFDIHQEEAGALAAFSK